MRVDRLLFCLRLIKSRTQAQALVEDGKVRADGRRLAKSSDEVAAGSVLSFALGGRVRIIRILSLPARRGPPAEARAHYEEIDEAASES